MKESGVLCTQVNMNVIYEVKRFSSASNSGSLSNFLMPFAFNSNDDEKYGDFVSSEGTSAVPLAGAFSKPARRASQSILAAYATAINGTNELTGLVIITNIASGHTSAASITISPTMPTFFSNKESRLALMSVRTAPAAMTNILEHIRLFRN
ncbi:hypothetical protein GQX74_004653 [Glossina fuscipes]|nr:hypothetical protein GQX74_004653 [Glossina fuscipes]